MGRHHVHESGILPFNFLYSNVVLYNQDYKFTKNNNKIKANIHVNQEIKDQVALQL